MVGLATTWRGSRVGCQVLGADAAFWRMSGVVPVVALPCPPTAATVPSLRAVTPESAFDRLPGLGLLTIFQLVPSQCSVRVSVSFLPTAQMSLAETAAIP